MKNWILLSTVVISVALVWMFVRVEPMFFYEETPNNAGVELEKINEEIRYRIVDKVVGEYNENREVQTPLYSIIECAYIATPKAVLVFSVLNVQGVDVRTSKETLNGQTVNMIYSKYKYSYGYRMIDGSSVGEVSRSGEIELENDGKSHLLSIPGVDIKVSYRTLHSLLLEHASTYSVSILDAESQCFEPLSTLQRIN